MARVLGAFNLPARSCFLIILVPMFAAAIVLRIVFAFMPPPRPELIPSADGLVEPETVEEARVHTTMPIAMPADLLGGEVYAVGVYTRGAQTLPVGSAAVVVTRDGWRFFELVERPSTTLEDVANDYGGTPETIAVGGTDAILVTIQTNNLPCVSPNERWGLPGFCEIERILAFERNDVVYTLSADAPHATTGELISLAASLLSENPPPPDDESTPSP